MQDGLDRSLVIRGTRYGSLVAARPAREGEYGSGNRQPARAARERGGILLHVSRIEPRRSGLSGSEIRHPIREAISRGGPPWRAPGQTTERGESGAHTAALGRWSQAS